VLGENRDIFLKKNRNTAWHHAVTGFKDGVHPSAGAFAAELTPVTIKGKKGDEHFTADEHPKPQSTVQSIGKLPPVFKKVSQSTGAFALLGLA
jgi:hypothetical protein